MLFDSYDLKRQKTVDSCDDVAVRYLIVEYINIFFFLVFFYAVVEYTSIFE